MQKKLTRNEFEMNFTSQGDLASVYGSEGEGERGGGEGKINLYLG